MLDRNDMATEASIAQATYIQNAGGLNPAALKKPTVPDPTSFE
jgi:hypothetical protein